MISLILFLAGAFLLTFLLGKLLEKIRVPWIFAALLVGLGLAAYNPFTSITSSENFKFLADLGLLFILFMIGFELDIPQMISSSKFIVKSTIIIILSEAIVGSIFVHYVFHLSWLISILLSLSFATVGEAVLVAILDEFKMVHTKLGQTILGIAVLDDIFEIATVVAVSILIGENTGSNSTVILANFFILGLLFLLTFILVKFRKFFERFQYRDISAIFLMAVLLAFLFIGIGNQVGAGAIGALLAGIAVKNITPKKLLLNLETDVKSLAYGFLGPIFFLSVGIDVDIFYILKYPLLVLGFMLVIKITKVTSSYFVARRELGSKKAIFLGVSLAVKFSTSIVILKLLLDNHLITYQVYSVFIGTKILFKFIVPFLLAYLIRKWHLSGKLIRAKAKIGRPIT